MMKQTHLSQPSPYLLFLYQVSYSKHFLTMFALLAKISNLVLFSGMLLYLLFGLMEALMELLKLSRRQSPLSTRWVPQKAPSRGSLATEAET